MNNVFLAFAILFAVAVPAMAVSEDTSARSPSASVITKRLPSEIDGVDFVISYDASPVRRDYAAESFSGLPDTDPYVVARGADKGLIHVMNANERRVKRYTIPHARIQAIVRIKYDMAVLEKADLVFTDKNLVLIHTYQTNAGVFTGSDVYELPYNDREIVDKKLLERKKDLLNMLEAGLSLYRTAVLPRQPTK
jgi:hypothetical protein